MTEHWILITGGIAVPLVIAAVGFWWRIESAQNRNLEKMQACNGKDHADIRKEISSLKSKGHEQHVELLGKVTEVWQHMVKDK